MSDLATAIEAEAAHRAEVAAAAPPIEPITATIPTGPQPITAAYTMWRAWWEGRDMWDGAACYVDRDTALTHAAIDYVGEEYSWPHLEDEDDEQAKPGALLWTWEHGAWHLSDGGSATLVQVYEERVYGPATVAAVPGSAGGDR